MNYELISLTKKLNEVQESYVKIKKENEKLNKQLELIKEYATWHVERCIDDIKDYIDDDKLGNKDIIANCKEDREHWRDVVKLCNHDHYNLYMNSILNINDN